MKAIEMTLYDLTIRVSDDGNPTRTITDCSIGRAGHHTPEFSGPLSNDRERLHISHKYHAPMPFSLFFEDGCAFHEGPTHIPSHGCVHLNPTDAEWLFDWAARDPVTVKINGPYPHSSIRAQ
jgi:hypothetical protein